MTTASSKAPIVIQPGEKTTVETPYSVQVGDQSLTGVVAQDVVAADPTPPAPQSPILLGSSTPPSGLAPARIEENAKALESDLGGNVLMLHRIYLSDWTLTGVTGMSSAAGIIANDKAAGRIPYLSQKPPHGPSSWPLLISPTALITQGEVMLAKAMQQMENGTYSFNHEAEDDLKNIFPTLTETQRQGYRDQFYEASCRHYDRLRAIGIPDGWKLGPTWQNYTLTPEGAAKFGPLAKWHQGSNHFDHVGFDDYPTPWDDNWAFAQSQTGRNGQPLPLVFGEFGATMKEGDGTPAGQAAYLQRRLDWLRAHRGPGLIGACWWDAIDFQAPTAKLFGEAIAAERALLAA